MIIDPQELETCAANMLAEASRIRKERLVVEAAAKQIDAERDAREAAHTQLRKGLDSYRKLAEATLRLLDRIQEDRLTGDPTGDRASRLLAVQRNRLAGPFQKLWNQDRSYPGPLGGYVGLVVITDALGLKTCRLCSTLKGSCFSRS